MIRPFVESKRKNIAAVDSSEDRLEGVDGTGTLKAILMDGIRVREGLSSG